MTAPPALEFSATENLTESTMTQTDLDLDLYLYHVVHNTEPSNQSHTGNIQNFNDLERMPRDSDNNANFEEPYKRLNAEYGSWENSTAVWRFNRISIIYIFVLLIIF